MLYKGVYTMKKQYHVISAKNFGYESVLGIEHMITLCFLLPNIANARLWIHLSR